MTASKYDAIIKLIADYAPTVASALGGPAAGLVVHAIESMFGLQGSTPDQLAQAIQTDPEGKDKILQIQYQHIDSLFALRNQDAANAREREEKIVELTGKRDWVVDVISILVVIGFFVLAVVNYFFSIKDDHVMVMLIGQISSGFLMVLAFYYGSSNK